MQLRKRSAGSRHDYGSTKLRPAALRLPALWAAALWAAAGFNGAPENERRGLRRRAYPVTLGSAIERRPEIRYSKNLLKLGCDGLFHLPAEPRPGSTRRSWQSEA